MVHTTNCYDTFIQIADDSPIREAEVPPMKGEEKTVATLQFEMLRDHPYTFTSDDVLFQVHAIRKAVPTHELQAAREALFSKGQACLRSSPLTKRYGWGVHFDAEGKAAIYPAGSAEYAQYAADPNLKQWKAMRSSRA